MRQAGAIDDDGRTAVVATTGLFQQIIVELFGVGGTTAVLDVGNQPSQRICIAVRTTQQVFHVIKPQSFVRHHVLVTRRVVEHEGSVRSHGVEAGGIDRATDDGAFLGLVTHIGTNAVDHAHLQDRRAIALVVVAKDVDMRIVTGTVGGNPLLAIGDIA